MPQRSATSRTTPSVCVGVEVVADIFLFYRRRRQGEQIVQERHEIGLGAGITDGAADFACGNIEHGDQGARYVPDALELRAARRIPATSAGSGGHVPAPGCRSASSIETVCTSCSAAVGAA